MGRLAGQDGRFLPGTHIEVMREDIPRGGFRHVLFDFDGTLSLIREGWQGVMIPMMVEILTGTPGAEPAERIEEAVRLYVTDLTGKQTIYQMLRLCEEVRKRGGTPLEPGDYKRTYHDRLLERIAWRREGLRNGSADRSEMIVPGSVEMLKGLRERGMTLYCASGTDEPYMREEADLLGLTEYFDGRIYGALDDYKQFSKHMLIQKIVADHGLQGAEFLAFGDGYVEIEDTRNADGVAVGVASDEAAREGVDAWKRERLVRAGAHIIIPDFREHEAMLAFLFDG